MAVRFRKTKKGGPLRLTVGKKSLGSSLGGKVAGVSFNTKNGPRFRVTVPGTGVTFTHKIGKKGNNDLGDDATQFSDPGSFETYKPPIPRKGWFVAIAVVLILGGLVSLTGSIIKGLMCLIIGIVMFVVRAKTPLNVANEQAQDEAVSDSNQKQYCFHLSATDNIWEFVVIARRYWHLFPANSSFFHPKPAKMYDLG